MSKNDTRKINVTFITFLMDFYYFIIFLKGKVEVYLYNKGEMQENG